MKTSGAENDTSFMKWCLCFMLKSKVDEFVNLYILQAFQSSVVVALSLS